MSEAQQPLNALPEGHRLQEYELESVLGVGDFGITYLGTDHNLDKPVAIKEYLPFDFATRTTNYSVIPYASDVRDDYQWGLDRFLEEARILAGFDHRHIIKVHRFFEAHGTAYIVMEYAAGETLSDYLEFGLNGTESELRAILYPILDGLEVVHRANLLHQDITPDNIVIRAEDRSSVLLNFSAASQAIGTKCRPPGAMLTSGYAPIEQYSEEGDQGPWTDLYSLGAVCYWALTGQELDNAMFRQPQSWVFAEWCDLRSPGGPHDVMFPESQSRLKEIRVNYAFLSVIDKALSVGKEDRLQTVGAWRTALEYVDHADVQAKKSDGDTPLHVAAKHGASSTAEVLLRWGAAVEAKNDDGDTPLHVAARREDRWRRSVAEELVRQGADVHAKNNDGDTPLHVAAGGWSMSHLSTAEELVRQGADVHAKNNDGDTPLHMAAKGYGIVRRHRSVVEELVRQGADVHAKNNDGDTPLHMAAKHGASSAVERLVRCGAAVEAKNNDGDTPLHVVANYAGVYGASLTAEELVSQGADVLAKNDDGDTPLHVMVKWQLSTHRQLEAGYEKTGRVLVAASLTEGVLLQGRAAVDARNDDGETPLHVAAEYDNDWMARDLLSQGAAVNVRDRFGYTPLYVAMEYNASATAEVLRRYGGRE